MLTAAIAAACAGGGLMTRSSRAPAGAAACAFRNPVMRGADPSVVRRGGFYYLVQSQDERITIAKAARLEELGRARSVTIWTPPDTGWNHTNIWAPELAYLDGRWYVYYAAADRAGQPFTGQRSGVLRARTDDPTGAWDDLGQLYTGDGLAPAGGPSLARPGIWAIDLTVGRVNGRLYAVWSGWERPAATDKTPQLLYVAPMANPWTITGPRRVLSAPNAAWERGPELDLQEGPEFLQHGGDTFLVYSTRDSWLPTYELGMLRYRGKGADPTDSASWAKSAGPVFASANGVIGTGHNTFTESPDGRQGWIVYHAKTSAAPGWDRVIHMQPYGWNTDGTPNIGAPVAAGTPVAAPSGECK
ncbi:hypothetical protein tb265_23820 [Gemmatimonadetes bacterium T265]|nr:hypothetical protein tb265_23820 [Gemmatimonadetes bacterium T265]